MSVEALDLRASRERPEANAVAGGYMTPETPMDGRPFPSVWKRPALDEVFLNKNSPRHDADSILAEAQAISLTLPIDSMAG